MRRVIFLWSRREALERLKEELFDQAIVDLRVPGDNGNAFIAKVSRLVEGLRFVIGTGSVEFRQTEVLKRHRVMSEYVCLKPLSELSILVDGVGELLNAKE